MNNYKQIEVFKNYTEILMNYLIQNNINITKTKFYDTDLISILLSNEHNVKDDTSTSIKNNLTIVDFQQCEDFLKTKGHLPKNETLYYSKVDWDSVIKNNINENTTSSSSVSYFLYASNGTKIDSSLCSKIDAEILIPIPGFNAELAANLTKDGYDLTDPNSEYFTSLCIPMRPNDKAYTIEDRLKEFNTLGLKCSEGCTYKSINITIGYLSCLCDTNGLKETGSVKGNSYIKVLQQNNFEIVKCWQVVFKFVT